ncbi:MAG: hypothetical protein ACI398_06955 [Clostridium sp.]
MEELSMDNVLSFDEIDNLFEDEETQETPPEPKENSDNNQEPKNKEEETTEVNAETLFSDEPESVGSEENTKE